MFYVIYNTKTKKFRSIEFAESWDADINNAAIFRTEKAAVAKIKASQRKWADYKERWIGHEYHSDAVKTYDLWQMAEVRKAELVLA
jgi:hypothetical protein